MNSKRKGKEGELRLVHFLREQGYECRRTAQYCGKTGEAADVTGFRASISSARPSNG